MKFWLSPTRRRGRAEVKEDKELKAHRKLAEGTGFEATKKSGSAFTISKVLSSFKLVGPERRGGAGRALGRDCPASMSSDQPLRGPWGEVVRGS